MTIENSLFERNGAGGRAHGIYINSADVLLLRGSQIVSTKGKGHALKSGAKRTVIEDSVLAALEGAELPCHRCLCWRRARSASERHPARQKFRQSRSDWYCIRTGTESIRSPHYTLVEDNWIIFDDLERCCRWMFHAKQLGQISVRRTKIVGMTAFADSNLNVSVANNRFIEIGKKRDCRGMTVAMLSLPKPGS